MLKGLRVLEYATYIAAPGAGGILSDWGADVIKIEPPGGDPIRRFFDTIGAESAGNPVFDMDNRAKRSAIVNAATPEGAAILRQLAGQSDVFLTNVRPGGLKRSGLDYDSLKALHPRLIYASVTGYGLSGPDVDRPGFDMAAFWSRSGMAQLHAPKGSDPAPIRTAMGDHVTSLATASAILAALYERDRTGQGRLVESSLLRTANYALASDMAIQLKFGKLASNRPREQAINPIANFFQTGDGRWICLLPRQGAADWAGICAALGIEALRDDPAFATAKARRQNGAAVVAAFDRAFAAFSFAEAAARLDAHDLVWAPVQTAAEAAADPQLRAAGGVVRTPDGAGGAFEAPASPVRFSDYDDAPRGPAPKPGEHTRALLAELGHAEDAIAALYASGAVA